MSELLKKASRILLLEFVNAEQFPGQIAWPFPLLKGHATYFGKSCRWIRFGMATSHFYNERTDDVRLGSEETLTLRTAALSLQPDLVISSHRLAEGIVVWLRSSLPGVDFALLAEIMSQREHGPGSPEPPPDRLTLSSPDFLFAQEMSRPGFTPEYRFEFGNRAARRHDRNNVCIITSRGCGHLKPASSNPFFEGVHLPEGLPGGCSFCFFRTEVEESGPDSDADCCVVSGVPAGQFTRVRRSPPPPTPIEWISLQIGAIARDLGPDRLPNAIVFSDIERPQILTAAVAAKLATGIMGDVRLLIGIRVDRLLSLEQFLRQLLTSEEAGVPPLQVYSCGIESFSREELGRMNKGTTPLMNLRGVNLLKEMELGFPGRFYYSGYMGLSFLLFTPWTTLADLHLNIRLIQHMELEDEVGNLFMSRLRLHRGLPITYLAEHDGATVEREEDDVLILNRRKFFPPEKAWRHLDTRVRPVSRIAVRLQQDASLLGDSLYQKVQAQLPAPDAGSGTPSRKSVRREQVEFLEAVIEVASQSLEPQPEEHLLAQATDIAKERRGTRHRQETLRLGEDLLHLEEFLERVLPLVRSGDKPAFSVPLPVGRAWRSADFEHVIGDLPFGLHESIRGASTPGSTLVVARDVQEFRAAWKALTEDMLDQTPASRSILARAGLAYGYPPCCVDAWLSSLRPHVDLLGWAVLQGRAAKPGKLRGGVNPLILGHLGFVPCDPDCAEASKIVRRWSSAVGIPEPLPSPNAAEAFWLDPSEGDELVRLRVTAADTDTLWYDPSALQPGTGRLRALLGRGDRLLFRPGQIQLVDGGRPVALWTANVGIWTSDRCRHSDEWRELARAALRNSDPVTKLAREAVRRAAPEIIADPVILGH